jgi:hypothetical protein
LLCIDVADLLLLDSHTGGSIRADIHDVVHSGKEPALVVRRDLSCGHDFPRWFVGVRAAEPDEEPAVEHEVTDARAIAALAGLWLGDLRRDVLDELRRRLDRDRSRA